ncbi:hypothetical protein J7M28_01665 [bacterium]|nr:hypothetical protein [bacterium]
MRRYELLVIVMMAIALFAGVCQAQDWFTYRTDNSSLEHNQVQCVCGDSVGRVWIGLTYNGMHLFDGTTWQLFNEDNSGLAGNYIRKIVIDGEGVKWIANHRGLSRFDETGWTWQTYMTSNSDIIGNSVKDIAIDYEGTIWLATSAGVSEFDGTNFTNYTKDNSSLATNDIRAIAAAPNGDIWVGTSDEGAAVLRGGSWTLYSPANCQIAGHDIYDVMIDGAQRVWFAAYDGEAVSVLDGTSWTTYNELNSDFSGRPGNIAQHPDGSVWISTDGEGLFMFQNDTWTVWDNVVADGIGSTAVRGVGFDSNGNVWAATLDGLSYMEREVSTDIEVNIYTDKSTYASGESLDVYANVYNRGTTDVHGTFYITLQWPNGTKVYWWTGNTDSFPIPLTLNADLTLEGYHLHNSHLDTMFMQKGAYTWGITYTDGASAILASDTASFTLQ